MQTHTKDLKQWGQLETEEHQTALSGDNPCYFCIADLEKRALERGIAKEEFKSSLRGKKGLVINY